MAYQMICVPDDCDPVVETYPTKREAVAKATKILLLSDDGWTKEQATADLKAGHTCRLGDAGSICVQEVA
jgi:hypothetical protein